jgi:hypothetical protein
MTDNNRPAPLEAEAQIADRCKRLDTWFDHSSNTGKSWANGTRELCERAFEAGREEVRAEVQRLTEERDGFRVDLEQLEKVHREFVDNLRHHIVIAPQDVEGLLERFGVETKARAEAAESQVRTIQNALENIIAQIKK